MGNMRGGGCYWEGEHPESTTPSTPLPCHHLIGKRKQFVGPKTCQKQAKPAGPFEFRIESGNLVWSLLATHAVKVQAGFNGFVWN